MAINVAEKMDELTPDYLQIKGGKYADFTVALNDKSIYSQAVARILHANDEHAARNAKYNMKVSSIIMAEQLINGTPVPIAIITVEVDSELFGIRQNTMTAVLDTTHGGDKISSSFPIEKAITQAFGRTLALYGFAFTGNLASEEEIAEGKERGKRLDEPQNTPLEALKQTVRSANLTMEAVETYCANNGIDLTERANIFKLINQIRSGKITIQ